MKAKKILKVEGMSCSHCSKRVETALSAVAGVASVSVDLKKKRATVKYEGELSDDALIAAVREAGYEASMAE